MNTRKKKNAGFSVIELVMAMSIALTLTVMLTTVLIGSLRSIYALTEKSFFASERRMVAQRVDHDMSYGTVLSAASNESFTLELIDETITYELIQTGNHFDLVREVFDPSDLVNPLQSNKIMQKLVADAAVRPVFAYLNDSRIVLPPNATGDLSAAQTESAKYIEFSLNRSYLDSANSKHAQSSQRKTFSFHLYDPTQ